MQYSNFAKKQNQLNMKKVFKILGILLLLLILGLGVIYVIYNQDEPEAAPTAEADLLADKMMASVNKAAWDSTRWVKWNFPNGNQYIWNKEKHLVQVTMGDNVVLLNPGEISGKAFKNGKEVPPAKGQGLIKSAWDNFNNDSFWLNAIVKAKDPGTVRSIVKLDDGQTGLKVEYKGGGTTPGDSYVWILDENNRPTSYKMWVKIIPVGGFEASWEQYEPISTGALISRSHKLSKINLQITDVAGGMNLSDVGLTEDPFVGM